MFTGMFKSRIILAIARRLHTNAGPQQSSISYRTALVSSSLLGGVVLWYSSESLQQSRSVIHSDSAIPISPMTLLKKTIPKLHSQDLDDLHTLVWGSNKSKTLLLDDTDPDFIRTPAVAQWLDGVALRDLAVHKDHSACIDARGDVYQWGTKHFGMDEHHRPQLTLRNKNIVQLQLTESRLFALSASGRLYCMEVDASKQVLHAGSLTPSSYPWWSTGWLWGEDEEVDFIEIKPQEAMNRKEKFQSISAGDSHLLALTSSGRVYGHPVNEKANAYGQLGLRKISLAPSGTSDSNSLLSLDLIPKSQKKPSDNSGDDSTKNTIRFCPFLFEVPALKGVQVQEIATGAHTSFFRTFEGHVLGFGANSFGQIGLGGNVCVDSVTVPTELTLWRRSGSKCVNVYAGGDLTGFVVHYAGKPSPKGDIMMSGNGQFGGLGNNIYTNAQATPVRVRGVGELSEYNEEKKTTVPILPRTLSISPTGHALLTLDTSTGGRDLYLWGRNRDFELGNGKQSSQPVPTTLTVLGTGERLMLHKKSGVKVKDLQGRVWARRANVEQEPLAGYSSSIVYWRIQN